MKREVFSVPYTEATASAKMSATEPLDSEKKSISRDTSK